MDRTHGCSEASDASSFLGASLGFSVFSGVSSLIRLPAYDAFRMTFIRSIFFWRAMIP